MDTYAAKVEMELRELLLLKLGDDDDQPPELTWHEAVEELAEIENLGTDAAEQILSNVQAWLEEYGCELVFRAEAETGNGRQGVEVEKEHDDEARPKEDNEEEEDSLEEEGKEDEDAGYDDENQNDGGDGSEEDDSQEENDGKEKDENEKKEDGEK